MIVRVQFIQPIPFQITLFCRILRNTIFALSESGSEWLIIMKAFGIIWWFSREISQICQPAGKYSQIEQSEVLYLIFFWCILQSCLLIVRKVLSKRLNYWERVNRTQNGLASYHTESVSLLQPIVRINNQKCLTSFLLTYPTKSLKQGSQKRFQLPYNYGRANNEVISDQNTEHFCWKVSPVSASVSGSVYLSTLL